MMSFTGGLTFLGAIIYHNAAVESYTHRKSPLVEKIDAYISNGRYAPDESDIEATECVGCYCCLAQKSKIDENGMYPLDRVFRAKKWSDSRTKAYWNETNEKRRQKVISEFFKNVKIYKNKEPYYNISHLPEGLNEMSPETIEQLITHIGPKKFKNNPSVTEQLLIKTNPSTILIALEAGINPRDSLEDEDIFSRISHLWDNAYSEEKTFYLEIGKLLLKKGASLENFKGVLNFKQALIESLAIESQPTKLDMAVQTAEPVISEQPTRLEVGTQTSQFYNAGVQAVTETIEHGQQVKHKEE